MLTSLREAILYTLVVFCLHNIASWSSFYGARLWCNGESSIWTSFDLAANFGSYSEAWNNLHCKLQMDAIITAVLRRPEPDQP